MILDHSVFLISFNDHNRTSRSKMELIHTKSRMKGQGGHELVEELKKETQKED